MIMSNIELFRYSGQNAEQILDPYYLDAKEPVIPKTSKGTNTLVRKNERLMQLVSTFTFYQKQGKGINHPDVTSLIDEVINILTKTAEINLSPFPQFFMVYDSSYAAFKGYAPDEKRKFLYEMLRCYGERRHRLYLCHGYTNSMLQVVHDSYSHKRKSKASIKKICEILNSVGFKHASTVEENPLFYFLPDDSDKDVFLDFVREHCMAMKFTKGKPDKLPDMVFHKDGEYYVVEMKHIKGSGGGQNKQLNEVIDFIGFTEKDKHVHYVSFLDGEYSNLLHDSSLRSKTKRKKQNKITKQYNSILRCLRKNEGNYFLNTAGFKKFVQQIVHVGNM